MKPPKDIKEAVKNSVKPDEKQDSSHAIGRCGDCGGVVKKSGSGFACCEKCGATHEHEHSLPVLSMKKK